MSDQTGTSVLNSIKKMLGIDQSYDVFDEEITVHINSMFSVLHSIGASPPDGFFITGVDETWEQYLQEVRHVQMVKTYIYLRVRLIFDPPASSFVLDAFKKQADELEWRLGITEFEFNPLSRPIDTPQENRVLADLSEKIESIDEEIDSVPDLSTILRQSMDG